MRRREFLGGLGFAATMPIARAQERERVKRIGILNTLPANDDHGQARIGAFLQALQSAGWAIGGNLRVDQRWSAANAIELRQFAVELVALKPDVMIATGGFAVGSLLEATRTVPVVFVNTPDPVGAGFVESLARPGGNVTGFTQFEYSTSVKWLELLRQISPAVTRVGVLRDPNTPSGIGQFGAMQGAATTFGVVLSPIGVRDAAEVERAVAAFAASGDAGLIATSGALTTIHRELFATLAIRHRLPAVYSADYFVAAGGLISYGPDRINMYRQAAEYADRILRGAKPADLPVQAPTKYQMLINLKAAKAIGITMPPSLIARADEVIE
jgi:putative tryptophan/tyrosine transport system substrate-binding protein